MAESRQYLDAAYTGGNVEASYGPDEGVYTPASVPIGTSSSGSTFMVGIRLTVLAAGRITGIRFWGTATVVSRYCALWTDAGVLLASGTFTGEATGWNTLLFSAPVAVTAGQVVRATYGYAGSAVSGNFHFDVTTLTSVSPNLRYEAGVYGDAIPSGGHDDFPVNIITPNHYYGDVVFQKRLGTE
jgi:hypothetical protein